MKWLPVMENVLRVFGPPSSLPAEMSLKLNGASQAFRGLLQLWFLDPNPSESRKRPTVWFLASQLMPILLVQAPDTENWILGHQPDGTQGQKAPGHQPVPIPDLPLHHPLRGCFHLPVSVTVNHTHANTPESTDIQTKRSQGSLNPKTLHLHFYPQLPSSLKYSPEPYSHHQVPFSHCK